ncbi:hypothetical protein FAP94_18170 [Morganella morganii]|nr:hypothetical protein [Morganella morganii]
MTSYRDRCHAKSIGLINYKKVYLDTKFWVILKDVHRGLTGDIKKVRLYDLVISLAESGKVVFPFSESHFEEFLKQTDPNSLESTLSLVYLLSKNTAIRPYQDRVVVEFEFMLRFMLNPEGLKGSYLELCSHHIWTCVAYGWGKFNINDSGEKNTYDNKIQDIFFDNPIGLKTYLEHLKYTPEFVNSFPDPTTKILNRRTSSSKKITNLLVNELKSEAIENKRYILNGISNAVDKYTIEQANYIMEILLERKSKNTLSDLIPSMNTFSTICATWIISQSKNVNINDFFDMHHAASALPYCDIFLTEKSLSDAINRIIPKYLPFQHINVYTNIDSAIEALIILSETLDH